MQAREDKFLRIAAILAVLGISRATLYRLPHAHIGFPKLQKLIVNSGKKGAVGLWASTLYDWIEAHKNSGNDTQEI